MNDLRPRILEAQHEDPQSLAEKRKVGQNLGVPTFSVQDDDKVLFRAMTTEKYLEGLPILQNRFKDNEFAGIAQNDVENLSIIEKGVSKQPSAYDTMIAQARQYNAEHKQDSFSSELYNSAENAFDSWWHNDDAADVVSEVEKAQRDLLLPSERVAQRRDEYLRNFPRPEMAGDAVEEFNAKIAKLKAREETPEFQDKWQKKVAARKQALREKELEIANSHIEHIKKVNGTVNTYETNQALKQFKDARGAWEGFKVYLKNPRLIAKTAVEGFAGSTPTLIGGVAAGMLTGGYAAPLIWGAGGANDEYNADLANRVMAEMHRRKLPVTAENWLSVLHDTAFMDDASDKAATKGLTVGALSALGGVAGGKLAQVSAKAGRPMAGTAAGATVEMAADALGEGGGQYLADGKIDSKEVLTEVIAGVPTSISEAASMMLSSGYARVKDKIEQQVGAQKQIDEAVQKSELRQAAPDLFNQLVEEAVESSDSQHMYIDASALNQDNVGVALLEALPDYQDAIHEAMQTGGSVQISRADYVTQISPNPELANSLAGILRFDENGASLNELAIQMEQETLEQAKADIEQAIQQQKNVEQSTVEVHNAILEELTAAKAYTPEVNKKMATLTTSFYDNMAQRLGTDAKSLYDRHKLNIISKTQSDTALNQEGFSFGLNQSTVDSIIERAKTRLEDKHIADPDEYLIDMGIYDEDTQDTRVVDVDGLEEDIDISGSELSAEQVEQLENSGVYFDDVITLDDVTLYNNDGTVFVDIKPDARDKIEEAQQQRELDDISSIEDALTHSDHNVRHEAFLGVLEEWGVPIDNNVDGDFGSNYVYVPINPVLDENRFVEDFDDMIKIRFADHSNQSIYHGNADYNIHDDNRKLVFEALNKIREVAAPSSELGSDSEMSAVGKEITSLFHRAKSNNLTGKPVPIGKLTTQGKEFLEKLSGLTFKSEIDFVLNPSDLKHIYRDHYGDNEKDQGNNIPLNDNDIEMMASVIYQPDAVVFLGYDKKTQSNKFRFLKETEKGAYNLVEVYGNKKGNLTAKSYYHTKRGVTQRVMDDSLLPTSETYFGTYPNQSVPLLFKKIKSPEQSKLVTDDKYNQSTEYAHKLPMDYDSRMERAAQMGFDTDVIYGHSSPEEIIEEISPEGFDTGIAKFHGLFALRDSEEGAYHEYTHQYIIKGEPATNEDLALFFEENPEKTREIFKPYANYDATPEEIDAAIEEFVNSGDIADEGSDLYKALMSVDYPDVFVDYQNFRADLAREAGFNAVEVDDEFNGETVMLLAGNGVRNIEAEFNSEQSNSNNLYLQNPDAPRGQYHPDSKTISLLEHADLSTFQHELGHFFLESMVEFATKLRQQAQDGEALTAEQQQVIDDLNVAMSWMGTDIDWWMSADVEQRREKHEQFARGFEAYLMEGKSPSIELQSLFETMRNWMISVYRRLTNLGVELNDDIRQVYDRLLASDDAIKLAEESHGLRGLFETAEQAGMDSEAFADYRAEGKKASTEAMNYMHERVARDSAYFSNLRKKAKQKLNQEAKTARAVIHGEAEQEVMQRPAYRAWDMLSKKQGDNPPIKLDKQSLLDLGFADESIQALGRKVRAKEGIHPEVLADMIRDEGGNRAYQSGAALVDDLINAKPPKDAINELTDKLMLMRFGELYSQESIAKAADIAVHNDIRLRVLTRESNALAKATGGMQLLRSTAKQVASEIIGKKRVRDIRPAQFTRQEAACAKKAAQAFKKGETTIAAQEKRNQMLQAHLAKEAFNAQAEVLKHLRYFNRVAKINPQKIDIAYREQIEQILDRIDFRKRSLKDIDKSASLKDWIEKQREEGIEPDIDPKLLNEAYRTSYNNMTLNELRGIVDSIKQIEHLGRLKNRLLTARKQKDIEKAKQEIIDSVEENAYKTVNNRAPATRAERYADSAKGFIALHMKIPMLARIMDGGKDGGVLWEYIIRPANEKAAYESTKRAEATEKLTDILAPLFKAKDLNTRKIKSDIYENGQQMFFTRQEVFAVALNMGNEGNLQRLLDGNKWTLEQAQRLISNLTNEELHAVQAVWDYMSSFRDEVAAKERRIYGKEPEWVEAKPLTIHRADGEEINLNGGYYPIKYDAGQNGIASQQFDAEDAKAQMQGAFTSATTRRSFTKSRSEKVVDRPLLLSLAGVYDGVNEVIHDLAWHEWLIDTNKLMKSKRVDASIRDHYGKETTDMIKQWIADIAAGDNRSRSKGYKFWSSVRRHVSVAALGWNLMSALKQPLGLTQTAVRVGHAEMISALVKYSGNPHRMTQDTLAASEMMRNRSRTLFRDVSEIRNTLAAPSWKRAYDQTVTRYAYAPMMFVQQMVDVITWNAEFNKHIGDGDQARAVALADQAVIDSQGGGEIKDLSGLERDEFAQFFTPFYSFMNTAYNMTVATAVSKQSAGKKTANLLMLLTAPALLDVLLSDMLKPGEDDKDLMDKLVASQIDYVMSMSIYTREFSGFVKGLAGLKTWGYSGPASMRLVGDMASLGTQAGQNEFDKAFIRSIINVLGTTTGLPAVQINKMIQGAEALENGDTDNPAALVMGYQK